MTLTVRTAPTAARKLVKSVGYIGQQLDSASRAEEDGIKGACENRVRITAKFAYDQDRAKRAIDETRAASVRYQIAVNVLLGRVKSPSVDELHQACADLHRMDAQQAAALADQMQQIALKAEAVADRAEDRLDGAEDDLRVTDALAEYLHTLSKHSFDKSNPAVRAKHRDLMAWKTVARQRA